MLRTLSAAVAELGRSMQPRVYAHAHFTYLTSFSQRIISPAALTLYLGADLCLAFSLSSDVQTSVEAKAAPQAEDRYYPCPVCGQVIDRKNLDQVYYHGPEPHEPRDPDALRYGD